MAKEKYQIESVNFGRYMHHENIIGILTGLPLDEINIALKKLGIIPQYPYDFKSKDIWNTRDYLNTFHQLGFNTNTRFKKFDTDTEYPCIMRCKLHRNDRYWYGWVYNNGTVYDTNSQVFTFDQWIQFYKKDYRVTSMLQVWI